MTKKKRQKLTKAQSKELALRKKRQQQMTWALLGVGVVAVAIVLILIVINSEGADLIEVKNPLRTDVETGVTEQGYPYRGSADAPVTLVEFSDYNCSVCGEFTETTSHLVDDQLLVSGQVKYIIQPFALWKESEPIVEAAICAREQGGFWDFHHILFANQGRFSAGRPPSRGMLREMVEAVGLDVDTFNTCLDQGRREQVLFSTESGKVEWGVSSTPTFFVNGKRTQLYTDKAYIDTLRKAVEAAQAAGSSE